MSWKAWVVSLCHSGNTENILLLMRFSREWNTSAPDMLHVPVMVSDHYCTWNWCGADHTLKTRPVRISWLSLERMPSAHAFLANIQKKFFGVPRLLFKVWCLWWKCGWISWTNFLNIAIQCPPWFFPVVLLVTDAGGQIELPTPSWKTPGDFEINTLGFTTARSGGDCKHRQLQEKLT